MDDLNPIEQAVVDVLTAESKCSWHIGCDVEDCYAPRAEAIVPAVLKAAAAQQRPGRSRNRGSARSAGKALEKTTADYFATELNDDRIIPRRAGAAIDRGDIANLRVHGQHVTVECKNTRDWKPGTWLRQAEKERQNDSSLAGIVVAKRHGSADPGQQVVLMTMRDFVALIRGVRPEETS